MGQTVLAKYHVFYFLSGDSVTNVLSRNCLAEFAGDARWKTRCTSSYKARVILLISSKFGNLKYHSELYEYKIT
jgi:hypothetical protein